MQTNFTIHTKSHPYAHQGRNMIPKDFGKFPKKIFLILCEIPLCSKSTYNTSVRLQLCAQKNCDIIIFILHSHNNHIITFRNSSSLQESVICI